MKGEGRWVRVEGKGVEGSEGVKVSSRAHGAEARSPSEASVGAGNFESEYSKLLQRAGALSPSASACPAPGQLPAHGPWRPRLPRRGTRSRQWPAACRGRMDGWVGRWVGSAGR